jgi:FlaA1/EpsC-like NDP-sugar epimerase
MPTDPIPPDVILRLTRRHRIILIAGVYTLLAALSLWAAFLMRFDFRLSDHNKALLVTHLWWVITGKLLLLAAAGQFSGLLTFFGVRDAIFIAGASLLGVLVIAGLLWFMPVGIVWPPRGVVCIDAALFSGAVATVRLSARMWGERRASECKLPGGEVPVAVIGAGHVGAKLIEELRRKPSMGLRPVVIFDDDRFKWGLRLHGIPIVAAPEALPDYAGRYGIREVLLAMPSAAKSRLREIVRLSHASNFRCVTVPSIEQLATGNVAVTALKEVAIEDLLGREAVRMESGIVLENLRGRVVMITGGGGSIGSELCRQVAACHPRRLLVVDQSEPSLFQIEQELLESVPAETLRPLVADVLDEHRMRSIFEEFRPEIIFHAAAHKHVPMMESQPGEAIKNNAFGTRLLVRMASEFAVDRFVLISTDKAINPTNAMGASKRMAEVYLQAWQRAQKGTTRFAAVRFGNVLGSSGSVIPIFKKQIAAGGPVKVTDPEMVRYFMTIPEAVGLVMRSGIMAQGGEIFVLDMGKPVRILDLATQMIELSGLKPGRDIAIEFTGLRPGEKLFEELGHSGEDIAATTHERIMRFTGPATPFAVVEEHFQDMMDRMTNSDPLALKQMMKELIPEYRVYEAPAETRSSAPSHRQDVVFGGSLVLQQA